ncbi:hypothetical protein A2Z00_02970 [Candidatus Gottesmanbacteria bacterium RBG_13_45_10]|uniref:Uncharacterized protein n=1 Tax=Candidatus Gottesmanbacteria bacterium RBG_13_45_10 TaxID=1798370 RepID=A0A1F5ZJ42_9BACT|nr:MAG: hypothetical protein A2Z00_02970 [Candidatus Gottesmanbacteria bacterium RBG_13_45_10]
MTLSRGSKVIKPKHPFFLAFGQSVFVFARGVFAFKKVLALIFFGFLTLSHKIARGDAREPWAALCAAPTSREFEPLYQSARTYFIKNS